MQNIFAFWVVKQILHMTRITYFLFLNNFRSNKYTSLQFLTLSFKRIWMSSVLRNSTFFSFRLITSPSQLSYVSVTVKRNFSSKHGIINRLNIPYKSTKSWYLDPTKDYIKSTKLLSTYQKYLKCLIYTKF